LVATPNLIGGFITLGQLGVFPPDFATLGISSLTIVPEPSTTVLLGIGIAALAFIAVRRRALQADRA
jgi:NAD/NADP transhydrogenase alpha subunit